ncbi:MAG: GAF domain-containing protein, partial [Bacteroidales bacterium]|nr:GAF domain-containing protein [Bacteroidales bacterium]
MVKQQFTVQLRISLVFMFIICSLGLWGNSKFQVEHINSKDGLSHDNVSAILQDKEGMLWFGSRDGLNMYDGYSITVYKPKPGSGVNISFILAMGEDDDGNIWIGTRGFGACIFNKKNKEFEPFVYEGNQSAVARKRVKGVVCVDSLVYLALDRRGLSYYNKNTGRLIINDTLHPKLGRVSDLHYYDGYLWIASWGQGIFKYKPGSPKADQIVFKNKDGKFLQRNIWGVKNSAKGEILISTWGGGTIIYDPSSGLKNKKYRVVNQSMGLVSGLVKQTVSNKENEYWVCCNRGIHYVKYYPKVDSFYVHRLTPDKDNPKSINSILTENLLFDKSGNLWIATVTGGVNKIDFNKQKFKHYGTEFFSDSIEKAVSFMHFVSDDEFYVGKRLKKINLSTGEIKVKNKLKNQGIPWENLSMENIEVNGKNLIVLGHWYGGITMVDGSKDLKEINSVFKVKGLGFYVLDVMLDNKNNLWVGSEQMVKVIQFDSITDKPLRRKNVRTIQPKFKNRIFHESNVRCIHQDKSGKIWIGSLRGLVRIDDYNDLEKDSVHYTLFSPDNTDKHKFLATGAECIYEDSDNNLWIGTIGGGLAYYHPESESFTYYTKSNGLDGDNIIEIIEDDNNILWMSTNRGLSRFNPDAPEGEQFKNYTVDDGLQGAIFINNAVYKNSNGEIFFGGPNGFNRFHPDRIPEDTVPPYIKITDFTVFNRSYEAGEYPVHLDLMEKENGIWKIKLFRRDYAFKLNFSALSYSNPMRNQYAYMLVNYDTKWQNVDASHRYASYSNLKPGKYWFKIKASNSGGYWSQEETKVLIEIIPPIWKRFWFQALDVILVLLLAFGFYRYRVAALKARQRVLEAKVEERTSELKEANNELQEQKEEILQQSEEISAQRDVLEEKNKLVEASLKQLETISEFGQKLTATLSIEAINDMMYQYVTNIIDFSAFGIGVYNQMNNSIVYPSFYDEGEKQPQFTKSLNDTNSLSSWCFLNQKPVLIGDIENEYKKYVSEINLKATAKIAQTRIHLPLTVKDKRIGILVINSEKRNAYSNDDITNIKTLASYISIALDNAKAYEEIHDKNRAIKESISYAQSIQNAFMPTQEQLDKYLDTFVLFKPKDIVSGDFYWFANMNHSDEKDLRAILCVADCT